MFATTFTTKVSSNDNSYYFLEVDATRIQVTGQWLKDNGVEFSMGWDSCNDTAQFELIEPADEIVEKLNAKFNPPAVTEPTPAAPQPQPVVEEVKTRFQKFNHEWFLAVPAAKQEIVSGWLESKGCEFKTWNNDGELCYLISAAPESVLAGLQNKYGK